MGNDKNLHIKTESVMFLNPRGVKWLTESEKGNLSVDVNVASHREREQERERGRERQSVLADGEREPDRDANFRDSDHLFMCGSPF